MNALEGEPCLLWRLPYELRCEIYLLATPARVVHVQEGLVYENEQDKMEAKAAEYTELWFAFKQFAHRLLHRPSSVDLRVHPDIAYFAHNWRRAVASDSRGKPRQTTLDHYGFRSSSGIPQPWTPTAETPAIPPEWLVDRPWIAFEMVRRSYLWSQAPIPPLLHTCSDARRVLMELGYQLAFATRTHGPRTWFHFGRDRLLLEKRPVMGDDYAHVYRTARFYGELPSPHRREERRTGHLYGPDPTFSVQNPHHYDPIWSSPYFGDMPLLSGSPWDVGPFSVADLRRVEHLVLGRRSWVRDALMRTAADLLPLLPNLREVWIQEWVPQTLQEDEAGPQGTRQGQTNSRPREIWACVPIEEMDAVGLMYWSRDIQRVNDARPLPASTGLFNDSYNRFKNVEQKSSFFEFKARELEGMLSRRDRPPLPLKVPRFRFVHVFPERLAKQFIKDRHSFWRWFNESQRAVARHKVVPLFEAASSALASCHLRWINQPDYNQWCQILRAVKNMDVVTLTRMPLDPDGPNILSRTSINLKLQAWYFSQVEVPEPSVDLL